MVGSVRQWLRELKEYSLYILHQQISRAVDVLGRFINCMIPVCMTGFFFLYLYGSVGALLFKGSFYRCVGEDLTNIRTKNDCLEAGYLWVNRDYNFDSVPQAMVTMLAIFSSKQMEIIYNAVNAVGIEQQPVKNYNPRVFLFFYSFILVGWFLQHLFVIAAVLEWRMQLNATPRNERRQQLVEQQEEEMDRLLRRAGN